jgi:ATP-dependent DNA helicase RecQ
MTRARHTLTLFADRPSRHPHVRLLPGGFLLQRSAPPAAEVPREVLARRYELLGLDDVDLGFAGSRGERHPIHAALAQLQPGSPLRFVPQGELIELADAQGHPVARLSQAACRRWKDRLPTVQQVRVVALVQRRRTDEQADFRQRCRCDRWEVPLAEVVYLPCS